MSTEVLANNRVTTLRDGTEYFFTLARWHNALVKLTRLIGGRRVETEEWRKHISYGGRGWFERAEYGVIYAHPGWYPGKCADATHETHDQHGPQGDGHQVAVVCAPGTRLFAIDVDNRERYALSNVADLVNEAEHAVCARAGGGWHAYVYVPDELAHRWPKQGPRGGWDVKSMGFVPLPGCVHYSGATYEPAGGEILTATAELLDAVEADRDDFLGAIARGEGGPGDAGEGNEPELFRFTGKLVADGLRDREEAWQRWLAHAQTLPLSVPDWGWTEDNRDVFERHWEYCLAQNGVNHPPFEVTLPTWAGGDPTASASGFATLTTSVEVPTEVTANELDAEDDTEVAADDTEPWVATDRELVARLAGDEGYTIPQHGAAGSLATEEVGTYVVDRTGVWRFHETVSANGTRTERSKLIAVRPFVVSRRLRSDRGLDRLELAYLTDDGERRTAVVDAWDAADRRKLPGLFDCLVVGSGNAAECTQYVEWLVTDNRRWLVARGQVVATALGWPVTGTREFIVGPDRPYPVDDVKNTGGWLAGHVTGGTLEGWQAAVLAVRERRVVQVLVAAAFTAPLLRLLGLKSFAVDLSGLTSTGKSVTLALAAAAWGDPDDILLSFKNSGAAVEHYVSMTRGVPVFLDESQLATEAQVEQLLYSLTDGHSRGRSRRDGSGLLDTSAFETVVLTTGERPLTSFSNKGGVLPRVVTASAVPYDGKAQADRVKEAARANFGHAGEAFTSHLLTLDRAAVVARYEAWRERLAALAETTVAGRRADSIAAVALASELAAAAGLTPPLDLDAWAWLVGGGDALEEHDEDKPLQALEEILSWVVLNGTRLYGHHDALTLAPGGGRWLGRWATSGDGGYVALQPEELNRQLEALGFDAAAVKLQWRERGWIDAEPKKTTRKVDLGRDADGRRLLPKLVKIVNLEPIRGELQDGDGEVDGESADAAPVSARLAWAQGLGKG